MKTQTFRTFYRYFALLAIYLAITTNGLHANHEVITTVNDKPITSFDLDNKVQLLLLFTGQDDTPELRKAHKKQALRLLVREMLQLTYIESLGIKFSDKEFDDALGRLERMNDKKPGFFKKLVTDKGISLRVLRLNVLANYAWQMFITERFKNFLTPSEAEVNRNFALVKKQQAQPHVRFYEIVLPFDSDEVREGAEQTGYDVLQHLDNGADFRALAQQISQSPTATSGGDVGWIAMSALDPQLITHIEGLSTGETSSLISLGRSFYIVKLLDKKPTAPAIQEKTYYSYVEAFIPRPKNGDPVELKRLHTKIPTIHKTATSEKTLRSLLKGTKGVQIKTREHVTGEQLSPKMLANINNTTPGQTTQLVSRDEGWYICVLLAKKTYSGDDLIRQQIRMQLRTDRIAKKSQGEMRALIRRAHVEDYSDLGISTRLFKKGALTEGKKAAEKPHAHTKKQFSTP